MYLNSGLENNLLEVFIDVFYISHIDLFYISHWVSTDLFTKILLSFKVTKQGFVQDRGLNVIIKFKKIFTMPYFI